MSAFNSGLNPAEIGVRRRELFPRDAIESSRSPRINGSNNYHCDICPKAKDELCPDPCDVARRKLSAGDGVVVT